MGLKLSGHWSTTVTRSGFRRTLVGLKQLGGEQVALRFGGFRRTLVGLKQAFSPVREVFELVSDVPSWG